MRHGHPVVLHDPREDPPGFDGDGVVRDGDKPVQALLDGLGGDRGGASAHRTRRDLERLVRDAVDRGPASPDAVRTRGVLPRSFSDRDRPMTSTARSKRG